ncbi:chymotrypsin-like [Plodia interpunctella]|uniref:chymotrypsin-like n=1 Tax=Plodia interpunctella TaxID=58824 RepID=UPI002367968C|nr:chymotrypsin-like [Plodia interpunctella]
MFLIIFYFVISLKLNKCVDPFITGGEHTKYRHYPHAVFLIVHGDGDLVCGGSVLNQVIVLTAAHCLHPYEDVKHRGIDVKYGHESIGKMKTTHMKHYMNHEKYDDVKLINDIGLVLTKSKIPLGIVKRIILLRNPPLVANAYVSGWGYDEYEDLQNTLKHTNAKLQNLEMCRGMGWMPRGVFCAGPFTGQGSADRGDSGGGLIVQDYIQIGIVSYKMPSKSLVGYTNVSYYLDWIQNHTETLYCAK